MSKKIHDFDGACRPGGPGEFVIGFQKTFSVGVFEVIPKASGKGTKRGATKVRVKGLVSNPNAVYEKAREIAALLDAGKYDGPRTVTVK
jgi:hypothetical protein